MTTIRSIEDIHKHAKELFAEVKAARDASEGPDREGAERLLVEIVREAVA